MSSRSGVTQEQISGRPLRFLTVLIPAYNERRTLTTLLARVLHSPFVKQVVVVDDGSTDGTAAIVDEWLRERWSPENVCLLRHAVNRGKGAAIRTGLRLAAGDVVVIQDADLEYDPQDYPALVAPIRSGRADVVYGCRILARGSPSGLALNRVCVRLLNAIVWLLFGRRITDEATGYKVFRTDLLRRLDLRCERFEFCPEVTAKLCRLGIPIYEVPIRYNPRSAAEGKKIGWRDAAEAFWTLLRWRFMRVRLLDDDELAAAMVKDAETRETRAPEVEEVTA